MNTTAWQKLTKEAFPDITKKENIVFEDKFKTDNTRTLYYRSKEMYIIAMNINHMIDTGCYYWGPMISSNYAVRMFHAEHSVTFDNKTGKIINEKKEFYSADSEDGMTISIDDENLEYCRYKAVETEDILA